LSLFFVKEIIKEVAYREVLEYECTMWVENGTAGVSYVINRGGVEDAGLSRRSSKLI